MRISMFPVYDSDNNSNPTKIEFSNETPYEGTTIQIILQHPERTFTVNLKDLVRIVEFFNKWETI